MPELPDLQVFSRNLTKMLSGKTVAKVAAVNSKKLNVSEKQLNDTLQKQKLKEVVRDGKELHFVFDKGDVLALHLMLHGKQHVFDKTNSEKSTIIEIYFTDDTVYALTDFQGQATPTLNPAQKDGTDALAKEMNAQFLTDILSKKKTVIKSLLLDQHIIRGIGNAYADEILYDAHISPFSASNKIPAGRIKDLAKSIRSVLTNAEKQILKSHPDIISGEVRDFLKVHDAKKKHTESGAEIRVKVSGSRKTYYTDEQELFN
jgi:formamidopyrimidine-DNA glycosylase